MEENKIYDRKKDEIVFRGSLYQCEEFLKELKKNGKVKTAFGYYIPNSVDDVTLLKCNIIKIE